MQRLLRFCARCLIPLAFLGIAAHAGAEEKGHARLVQTPYSSQKVVFDFFFDRPEKMGTALFWVRSLINPLTASPYDMAPEFLDIVVVIHGTELVTVAKKNYAKYREVVERMRYYAQLGVQFKVCALAAQEYGYTVEELYEFIDVVPSAMPELAHWQQQGYALIVPQVLTKQFAIEDIR